MNPNFDSQPTLFGDVLELRPLAEGDLEALYAAASAPEIWEQHPAKERYRREVFEPYARWLLKNGGTLVVIDRRVGQVIGCSRYYVAPDEPDAVSIGFTFLHQSYWGGASGGLSTNAELKRLMLEHAFGTFAEVLFHIAPTNVRSQKATAKLGAEHVRDAVLDISGSATLWMCWRLKKEVWEARVR